jgi:hypothetical protein
VAQLRTTLSQTGKTFSEFTNTLMPLIDADDRTVQRRILGKATHNGFDIAGIQRCGVAHKQIINLETVLKRVQIHRQGHSAAARRVLTRSTLRPHGSARFADELYTMACSAATRVSSGNVAGGSGSVSAFEFATENPFRAKPQTCAPNALTMPSTWV